MPKFDKDIYDFDGLMQIDDLKNWPKKDVKTMVEYYLLNVVGMNQVEINNHIAHWMPDLL